MDLTIGQSFFLIMTSTKERLLTLGTNKMLEQKQATWKHEAGVFIVLLWSRNQVYQIILDAIISKYRLTNMLSFSLCVCEWAKWWKWYECMHSFSFIHHTHLCFDFNHWSWNCTLSCFEMSLNKQLFSLYIYTHTYVVIMCLKVWGSVINSFKLEHGTIQSSLLSSI